MCFITGAGPVAAFRSRQIRAEERRALRSRVLTGTARNHWHLGLAYCYGITHCVLMERERHHQCPARDPPLLSSSQEDPWTTRGRGTFLSLYLGVGVRVGGDAVLNKENLHRVEISRKGFQEHIPFLSPRSARDAGVGELITRTLRKKAEEPRRPRGGRLQPWLREALPLTFLVVLGHSPQQTVLQS